MYFSLCLSKNGNSYAILGALLFRSILGAMLVAILGAIFNAVLSIRCWYHENIKDGRILNVFRC